MIYSLIKYLKATFFNRHIIQQPPAIGALPCPPPAWSAPSAGPAASLSPVPIEPSLPRACKVSVLAGRLVPGHASPALCSSKPSCWVLAERVPPQASRECPFAFRVLGLNSWLTWSGKGSAWEWSLAGDCTALGINAVGSTLPKGWFLRDCPIDCKHRLRLSVLRHKPCGTRAAATRPLCGAVS